MNRFLKANVTVIMSMALTSVPVGSMRAAEKDAPGTSATSPYTPPTVRYEAHIAAGGALPNGGKLVNPYAGDKSVAATGEQMFSSMNCDGCHGGGATGFAAPSLADGRWRYGGADEELFQTIYFGRPKGMPAFGGLMSPEDVWTLVTYLKSLPVPENVPTQSWIGK